jgi:hypothetical protein
MRRAQAALEYVVTYGWGFLVVLILVGVIAYFGLLSPSRYVPERCEFGMQLQCVDYTLMSNGTSPYVQLQFRNNFADDINITGIYTLGAKADIKETIAYPVAANNQINISRGKSSLIIAVSISNPSVKPYMVQGDRVSIPLRIEFWRDGKSMTATAPLHNITGELFAKVQ